MGAHWFTLYDESALGRYDGENNNIGFLDMCNRPYEEMSAAAIVSHERMYDVADGRAEPFHEAIELSSEAVFVNHSHGRDASGLGTHLHR